MVFCWETVILLRNCQLKDKLKTECLQRELTVEYSINLLPFGQKRSVIIYCGQCVSSINIPYRGHESTGDCL